MRAAPASVSAAAAAVQVRPDGALIVPACATVDARMSEALKPSGSVAAIDLARASSDPAYAAQIQARMQSMSMAERMAMANQIMSATWNATNCQVDVSWQGADQEPAGYIVERELAPSATSTGTPHTATTQGGQSVTLGLTAANSGRHRNSAASRMTAVGHGQDSPVASNSTADGRAQNRRVDLVKK